MKITDFALIFIAITLPIIIVVYINVSYTIKAEEQEMYYEQLINLAIEDATSAMKEIENEDTTVDYGYSGEEDKKISVNANIAMKSFFNSLYNNFDIKGNVAAQRYLQLFVPTLAIIDYNGVYISSIEEYNLYNQETKKYESTIEHTVKPKKYYTYTYYVLSTLEDDNLFRIISAEEYTGLNMGRITSAHTIEFTMDDYITHRGCTYGTNTVNDLGVKSFYMADTDIGSLVNKSGTMTTINDSVLYVGSNLNKDNNIEMIQKIVNHLKKIKNEVIIKTITDEIAYSVNANNFYATNVGITYDFVFPPIEQEKMGEYINEVGILAFVQGLSIGNKYLNTQAYSVSRLELVNKYYLSIPNMQNDDPKDNSKYDKNLYHSTIKCPEYRISINKDIIPIYVTTKQQAASVVGKYKKEDKTYQIIQGFYPCPVCKP